VASIHSSQHLDRTDIVLATSIRTEWAEQIYTLHLVIQRSNIRIPPHLSRTIVDFVGGFWDDYVIACPCQAAFHDEGGFDIYTGKTSSIYRKQCNWVGLRSEVPKHLEEHNSQMEARARSGSSAQPLELGVFEMVCPSCAQTMQRAQFAGHTISCRQMIPLPSMVDPSLFVFSSQVKQHANEAPQNGESGHGGGSGSGSGSSSGSSSSSSESEVEAAPTARTEDDMFRINDEEEQSPKSPEQVLAMHKLNGLQKGDEVEVGDITTVLGGVVFEVGQLLHQIP
jgi:hypothetical protein